jgi:DNA-binding IclR family transcriptional regulator
MRKVVRGDRHVAPSRASGNGKGDQRRIQSIEVGFQLIRVLEQAGTNLPLKDLAARAAMAPSKAHLYLVSFVNLGLVVQEPLSMRYGLGPYAVHLGLAGIRQLNVVEVARERMEELEEKTGMAVYLSIWGNRGPTIIMKLDKALSAPISIRVGYVLPLMATATGRAFLAYMPRSETASILKEERLVDPDLRTRAKKSIEAVRRYGVAFSDGRHHQGLSALSAPIFDHSGSMVAAVTLLGFQRDMNIDPNGAMAKALRAAGSLISASLGSKISDPPNGGGAPIPLPPGPTSKSKPRGSAKRSRGLRR